MFEFSDSEMCGKSGVKFKGKVKLEMEDLWNLMIVEVGKVVTMRL